MFMRAVIDRPLFSCATRSWSPRANQLIDSSHL
jgi:hypothetical protein